MPSRTSPPRTPRTVSRRPLHRPASHRTPLDRVDRPGPVPVSADLSGGLAVQVRQDLPRPLVTVVGRLDLAGAGLLTAMIEHVRRSRAAGGGPDVDLDLSGTTVTDVRALTEVLDPSTCVVAGSQTQPTTSDVPTGDGPANH